VDPGTPGFQALLAALGRGLHVAYLVEMAALLLHGGLLTVVGRLGGHAEDGFGGGGEHGAGGEGRRAVASAK
jgi:hypothetical protein